MPINFNAVNLDKYTVIGSDELLVVSYGDTGKALTSKDLENLTQEDLFSIAYKGFIKFRYAKVLDDRPSLDEAKINTILFERIEKNLKTEIISKEESTNLLYESLARLCLARVSEINGMTFPERPDFYTVFGQLKSLPDRNIDVTEAISALAKDFPAYTKHLEAKKSSQVTSAPTEKTPRTKPYSLSFDGSPTGKYRHRLGSENVEQSVKRRSLSV